MKKAQELADILFSKGYDVVFITENQIASSFPIICKSEKYINMKFDNAIATSWKSYSFIKNYADIKTRYYLTDVYKTERYDDGDYSKFAANQTFYSMGDVKYIALDETVSEVMESKYGEEYTLLADFLSGT